MSGTHPAGPAAAGVEPEAPWLREASLETVERILRGHEQAFGRPLLAGLEVSRPAPGGLERRRWAQELFAGPRLVLAHDGGSDPRLIYANAAALRLWRRPWAEMVGLPSRLTAEPFERRARAEALAQARRQEALTGYSGIRIDSRGRRFRIAAARLWTLRDARAEPCGQAACFADWWWL